MTFNHLEILMSVLCKANFPKQSSQSFSSSHELWYFSSIIWQPNPFVIIWNIIYVLKREMLKKNVCALFFFQ